MASLGKRRPLERQGYMVWKSMKRRGRGRMGAGGGTRWLAR
jgi:hypothetical protein